MLHILHVRKRVWYLCLWEWIVGYRNKIEYRLRYVMVETYGIELWWLQSFFCVLIVYTPSYHARSESVEQRLTLHWVAGTPPHCARLEEFSWSAERKGFGNRNQKKIRIAIFRNEKKESGVDDEDERERNVSSEGKYRWMKDKNLSCA